MIYFLLGLFFYLSGSQLQAMQAAMPTTTWTDFQQALLKFPQSGRVIKVKFVNNRWQAYFSQGPRSAEEESNNRQRNLKSFLKVNFDRKSNESDSKIFLLLQKFSLDPAGAFWLARVAAENVQFFNSGFLNIQKKLNTKRTYFFDQALDSGLSEEGEFEVSDRVFRFSIRYGYGASASSGCVYLGNRGFLSRFPKGGQLIDDIAILSHEFGHTRFGDPTSGGTLEGERKTVIHYENPVRILHKMEPRRSYHSTELNKTILIESGEIFE